MTTATETRQASPAQVAKIKELLSEIAAQDAPHARDLWEAVRVVDELGHLTGWTSQDEPGAASKIIGNLIAELRTYRQRDREVAQNQAARYDAQQAARSYVERKAQALAPRTDWAAKRAQWAQQIPFGPDTRTFYAGIQLSQDPQVRYYRLKITTSGMIYVDMFISDNTVPVRGARAAAVIDAVALDPIASGKVYADEYVRCYDCNRRLTDDTSRQLGIGPVCRAKH